MRNGNTVDSNQKTTRLSESIIVGQTWGCTTYSILVGERLSQTNTPCEFIHLISNYLCMYIFQYNTYINFHYVPLTPQTTTP